MPRKAAAPSAKPEPIRPSRLAARREKAERKLRIFNLLKAGVPVAQIALQEGLTGRRLRGLIHDILARREADPPAGFVQLQIGRLGDAMMVAHAAMMEGDLQALDRFVRLVGELDRYHGYGRAPADPPKAALAAPALPLTLAAPTEAEENRVAKD